MDKDDADLTSEPKRSDLLGRSQLGGGRLGTYTVLGAACGVVPLPWVPDATVRRVRGALVHDLTSRHGLSLTHEARTILVEPNGTEGPRGFLKQGATFAISRVLGRIGPFAFIPPGALRARHLRARASPPALPRDGAHRALGPHRHRGGAPRAPRDRSGAHLRAHDRGAGPRARTLRHAPEDLREGSEQLVDGVLISIASMPGWLVRRLDAAFDEVLSTVRA